MKFEISDDVIAENKDFMRSHRDFIPLHIVRARVESIELPLSKTNMVPFDAIIVPRVNLRIPEATESILSASIKISPSSSREER